MPAQLIKAFAQFGPRFGPWALCVGILAWRAPDVIKIILEYRLAERDSQRKYEIESKRLDDSIRRRREKSARKASRRGS